MDDLIREYDTYRIPDDALVDWENEYLTYCERCKKDLIISKDLPAGHYYCGACREELYEEMHHITPIENKRSTEEKLVTTAKSSVSRSNIYFSRAIVFFLFALAALMLVVAIDLARSTTYQALMWTIFIILLGISFFFFAIAGINKWKEYKNDKNS